MQLPPGENHAGAPSRPQQLPLALHSTAGGAAPERPPPPAGPVARSHVPVPGPQLFSRPAEDSAGVARQCSAGGTPLPVTGEPRISARPAAARSGSDSRAVILQDTQDEPGRLLRNQAISQLSGLCSNMYREAFQK